MHFDLHWRLNIFKSHKFSFRDHFNKEGVVQIQKENQNILPSTLHKFALKKISELKYFKTWTLILFQFLRKSGKN